MTTLKQHLSQASEQAVREQHAGMRYQLADWQIADIEYELFAASRARIEALETRIAAVEALPVIRYATKQVQARKPGEGRQR